MIQCKFENSSKANLRHVTVGVLVINENGKILLVKRAPGIWNGNKYTIPGGFLDRDEDGRTGAQRELLEETGLIGENLLLFRINDSPNRPKEDRQNVDILYIAERVGGEVKTDKEVATVEWFDESNLPADEQFAFDHRDSILRYFEYQKKQFALPIVG